MSVGLEDRDSISALHNIGGRLATPAQLRDASGSVKWSKPPTKITTPSNGARTPGGNPFSGRIRDNLHAAKGGNVAAQSTALGYVRGLAGQPPHKKARTENGSVSRSRKKSSSSSIETSRPPRLGDPDNTGVIIYNVDDYEDEDMGQPISRGFDSFETDDLNLPSKPSGSSRSKFDPVADGASTKRLRQEARDYPPPAPSDDSIESWDAAPESPVGGKPGNVKQKVQVYERKSTADTHPFLDLETVAKPGMKDRMKAKKPQPAATIVPMNSQKPKPKPTSKQANKTHSLPIQAWYLGRKFFDESYHLLWTSNGKITIRSGDASSAAAKHSEEIDVDGVAERVFFVPPNDPADKIFCMQTFPKMAKSKFKVFGTQFSSYFKLGGSHGEGDIVIKFDSTSPAWADDVYVEFVEWLQDHVDKREKLMGKGAVNSKWEATGRMAAIVQTRAKRESGDAAASTVPKAVQARAKTPAVPGIPLLDNWEPPPPGSLAIANTAKAASLNQRQGSPIEVGSPTPRTRPLNGLVDSDTAGGGRESVRRSARHSVAPQRPTVDMEEVILVYPPGQTGAVNITNADVARLAPGEFLNDTLIEFGLKLWLQDLEKEDPELVKQIHVFSSFFYKKLDNKDQKDKKNRPEKGYESVRKWTAKFDLFAKKYIIVPINENLHWYLAIIYQPEHTLKPPLPKKSPSTRRKTRQEAEQSPELDQVTIFQSSKPRLPDSRASSVTRRTPSPAETAASAGDSGTLSPNSNVQAEAEVAEVVDQLRVEACSLDDEEPPPETAAGEPEVYDTDGERDSLFDEDIIMADVDEVEVVEGAAPPPEAPPNDSGSHTASEEPVDPEAMMDGDAKSDDPDRSVDPLLLFSPEPSPVPTTTVKTTAFYSTAKSRGKRKASSPFEIPSTQEGDDDEVEDGQPSTYVFILDSLGGRHARVNTVLGNYLQLEAREKKGIPMDKSRKPIMKQAQVPHQPNFCDCGIYLLHLAQTFISNPTHYFNLINKKGTLNSLERQAQWKDDQTKTLRQSLEKQIGELSLEWKKLKKAQEESVPESSDDDVDIVDTTPATPVLPPRHRKVHATGKAARLR
ncbi:hypothetical protein K438DRAFT_1851990 [Mycena galopus ATCC 62051]|nr:hypothetical protein K438DRAFT_1851990 [Mycena galopus ATCC 62051]